jgi:high-affinity iron transporter
VLGSFVIVLREVIEAGLIVGIVLAAARGASGRGRWVALGVIAGLAGACVLAIFAGSISKWFEGSGQELLNAAVLLVAVVMLAWHNAWMARHGRELAVEMRHVGEDVRGGHRPFMALAIVCGLAILREGSEVVLFLYGIVVSGVSASQLLIGGMLGVAGGIAFTALTYFGLLAIPTRYIFSVTGVLIALVAAGMAGQAMLYLNAAGVVTVLGNTVWDTSWLLSQSSFPGLALKTLVGYSDQPTAMQIIAYVATIFGMVALSRIVTSSRETATAS